MRSIKLEIVEAVREMGRLGPAAKSLGIKRQEVVSWMADPEYRALIEGAVEDYKDNSIGQFLQDVKDKHFKNTAEMTGAIFVAKWADPAFNDKLRLEHSADEGLKKVMEMLNKAVRKSA